MPHYLLPMSKGKKSSPLYILLETVYKINKSIIFYINKGNLMDVANNHHPKALIFLFLTEMWERFGFYVAQGLLVLYMTGYFGFSDNTSYTISGIFAGLVYI